jgi:hypothetical protein
MRFDCGPNKIDAFFGIRLDARNAFLNAGLEELNAKYKW